MAQQILAVAVVDVVELVQHQHLAMVVTVVQVFVLFVMLVLNGVPAAQSLLAVATQSTPLHHLVHIRLNHAKHNKCTSRKCHNLHSPN
jgi:hypothetical protein